MFACLQRLSVAQNCSLVVRMALNGSQWQRTAHKDGDNFKILAEWKSLCTFSVNIVLFLPGPSVSWQMLLKKSDKTRLKIMLLKSNYTVRITLSTNPKSKEKLCWTDQLMKYLTSYIMATGNLDTKNRVQNRLLKPIYSIAGGVYQSKIHLSWNVQSCRMTFPSLTDP